MSIPIMHQLDQTLSYLYRNAWMIPFGKQKRPNSGDQLCKYQTNALFKIMDRYNSFVNIITCLKIPENDLTNSKQAHKKFSLSWSWGPIFTKIQSFLWG